MPDTPTATGEKKPKVVTIIVNAEEKSVPDAVLSYEEVTKLAYPTSPYADPLYTVSYRNADKPREGTLVEGQSVTVKRHGTVFNVHASDKS